LAVFGWTVGVAGEHLRVYQRARDWIYQRARSRLWRAPTTALPEDA